MARWDVHPPLCVETVTLRLSTDLPQLPNANPEKTEWAKPRDGRYCNCQSPAGCSGHRITLFAHYRLHGQNSKIGVMSGLATIRQEPELRPAMSLSERVARKSTVEIKYWMIAHWTTSGDLLRSTAELRRRTATTRLRRGHLAHLPIYLRASWRDPFVRLSLRFLSLHRSLRGRGPIPARTGARDAV